LVGIFSCTKARGLILKPSSKLMQLLFGYGLMKMSKISDVRISRKRKI